MVVHVMLYTFVSMYLNGSSCNVIYVCEYVFEVLPVKV